MLQALLQCVGNELGGLKVHVGNPQWQQVVASPSWQQGTVLEVAAS